MGLPGPDLAQTLGEVPELMALCLACWKSRGEGLRELRLVSKEVGMAVLQAVQSCSLQFGDGASPNPHRLARLMSFTHLNAVTVTVLVTSGSMALSTDQQLLMCLSDTQSILKIMQASLTRVTQVRVAMQHTIHPSNVEPTNECKHECTVEEPGVDKTESLLARMGPPWRPPVLEEVPVSLVAVASAVICLLASAMPHVRKLSIGKGCGEAAITAFGKHCHQLSSLDVDVHTVPASALKHISMHLPQLSTLHMCGQRQRGFLAGRYLEAVLVHIQACAVLTVFEIDNIGFPCWTDKQETWDLAPASLQDYRCHLSFSPYEISEKFCGRLRHLSTAQGAVGSLHNFLSKFPLLRTLTFHKNGRSELILYANNHELEEDIPLKQRFKGGFQLSCRDLCLRGSSEAVRDSLEWLPPQPSTTQVSITLTGPSRVTCLQQIARVFPKLEWLSVLEEATQSGEAMTGLDAACFAPLAGCVSLRHVGVFLQVHCTTNCMFVLCSAMPMLESLDYMGCEGVDLELLKEAVDVLLERDITIEEHWVSDPED